MQAEPRRGFIRRMLGAAMLDIGVYEEVEHDVDATGQALLVVLIVAACAAAGGANFGSGGVAARALSAVVGWAAWAGVTYWIGVNAFGGTATWGELLRTLGFAQSPGVVYVAGASAAFGTFPLAVASIWMLFAGLVAIRQALDFDTGKALVTAFLGWLPYKAADLLIGGLFGIDLTVW